MEVEDDVQPNDQVEIELLPLTRMIARMFGNDFVDFVREKYGNVRKFYETSSATTQCHNTIGRLLPNISTCWICGFGIPDTKGNTQHGFSPECEHIFPIAQAIFFIGVYTNEIKANPAYIEKLKLEYAWSHRVCNQIKNDAHFIEHDIEAANGRWSINIDKIKAFLNDILDRGNLYGRGADLLKEQIQKARSTREKWIDNQSGIIYQKCKAILDTIEPKDENLWLLTTVSDLTYAYENSGFKPEIIPPSDTIAVPGQMVAPTMLQINDFYTTWAKYMMKIVQKFMIAYLGERIRRYTSEEKALRSEKVLAVLKDAELISKIQQEILLQVYNSIPNNPNKQARFVEAIYYLILSVISERMGRIFTDPDDSKSNALRSLDSDLRKNLEAIREIWNTRGLQDGIDTLNGILATSLKGASRRRRR
jgi:hypothetical protein